MTIKEELREARRLKVAVDGKRERLEELRAIAEGTTADMTGMPGSKGATDKLGSIVATIVDFSNELAAETVPLIQKQRDIQELINKIGRQDYRTVLELYYLNGYKWEKVALKIGLSLRLVYYYHGEALRELESLH